METINGQSIESINITELGNDLISVDVVLGKSNIKKRLSSRELIPFLREEKKINIESCIKSTVLTSSAEHSGNWIFKCKSNSSKLNLTQEEALSELTHISEELGLYNSDALDVESSEELPKKKKKKSLSIEGDSEASS